MNKLTTLTLDDRRLFLLAAKCVDNEARKYGFEAKLYALAKPEHRAHDAALGAAAKRYAQLKRVAARLRELAKHQDKA